MNNTARTLPTTYLDDKFLQQTVQKMIQSRAVHGAILRVENGDGSFAWTGAAGNLNAGDRYFIASVTKLYVTAVVQRLRRENTLDLEATIDRYLPAAKALLDGRDEPWPLERIVDRVRTLKPRFRPGQPGKVHYSDTNYELLGRIIETVTGQSTFHATSRR